MKLKRLGTSAAAVALVLAAGCGTDSGGTATAESNLTKANFASKVVGAQEKARTAHLEANISAQGQQVTLAGDMDMTKGDVAFDLTLSGAAMQGGNAHIILLDQVMYMQVPGLTQGDKYVKIDLAKSDHPAAAMFEQMLSQLDPSKTFQAFDAITKLQKKGTTEIDGVETTRYAVTVDTHKALEAQGLGGQVPSGQLPKTIQYDVWVDADNLVRRLSMNIQGSTIQMNISQWGEPVDITAPPASQTTEMPQMR